MIGSRDRHPRLAEHEVLARDGALPTISAASTADVAGLTLGIGSAAVLALVAGIPFSPLAAVGLVASIWAVMTVAVIVHELGHLAVGGLLGFAWREYRAGPLVVVRCDGRLSLGLSKDSILSAGGAVEFAPTTERSSRGRTTSMLLGGPAFSLMAGALGLLGFGLLQQTGWLRFWVGLLGACSLIQFVMSMLPASTSNEPTDLSRVVQLMRRDLADR